MDIETSINRGREAQRVLAEPVLIEAFEALEKAYIAEFTESTVPDKERRETAYLSLTAIRDLKSQIQAFITDGQMSEARLKKARL